MQQADEAWIAMFRRIPTNLHDTLVLALRTGAEIVLQKIIRLEPDFMIVRGRVSGTQDAGRVTLIPYTELTYVSMTRMMKDPEVEAIFGKSAPSAGADLPAPPPLENGTPLQDTSAAESAASADSTEEAAADEVEAPKKPETISKTALLAKLRDRLKEPK